MATTPVVEVTVKNIALAEIKAALEVLDNPNSANPNPQEAGKPTKWKFKQAGITRYDLSMSYREVADHARAVEKARLDLVRSKLDEQLTKIPDSDRLQGKWNADAMKEVDELWNGDTVLKLRQVPLSSLDLENNAIPFTAIAVLVGNVLSDDTAEPGD